MPPPLPSHHRGMTANPLKPSRYRPGKPVAEEPSSDEDDDGDEQQQQQREEEERRERERLRRLKLQQQQQRAAAPKASSFPAGAAGAGKITKGVKDVRIEAQDEDEDEEGFVTEEEEEEETVAKDSRVAGDAAVAVASRAAPAGLDDKVGKKEEEEEEEEEEESEEESSEEESSSEEEAPRRVLLRPTFIKKDKRTNNANNTETTTHDKATADSHAESEARRAQRQEKADTLVREQLEKEAIARSAANRAWDDDELEAAEESALDDKDGVDPEAEYAAWKLRELKRIKRSREAIEQSEKEREEVERRRNLTAEERDREDREFLARQQEDKEATRGQGGYMQRYFHKGAFFREGLEEKGLDKRALVGAHFVDDVSRETLPEYMQIRDMTKLGKKGRTRYKDLRSEDTGRFGDGLDGRRRREGAPVGVTDERFLPDSDRRGDGGPMRPTGANAGPVQRRRSRSRSPRGDRHGGGDRTDRYRPEAGGRRKRSPSPYEDREKRRRTSVSPR